MWRRAGVPGIWGQGMAPGGCVRHGCRAQAPRDGFTASRTGRCPDPVSARSQGPTRCVGYQCAQAVPGIWGQGMAPGGCVRHGCRAQAPMDGFTAFRTGTCLTPCPHVARDQRGALATSARKRCRGYGVREWRRAGVRGMDAAPKPPWMGLRRPARGHA